MNLGEQTIDNYLTALRSALRGLPASDCEEIISEIRAHLRDSIQQPDTNVESVISRLGPVSELAEQYRESLLMQRTVEAVSPLLIIRAVLRLATVSGVGFVLFLLALLGYGSGVALILSALLKPILPREVGLWVGPGVFNFGFEKGGYNGGPGMLLAPGASVHELLGWWYMPVALALGALFIWSTTWLIRKLLRRTKAMRPRPSLYSSPAVSLLS